MPWNEPLSQWLLSCSGLSSPKRNSLIPSLIVGFALTVTMTKTGMANSTSTESGITLSFSQGTVSQVLDNYQSLKWQAQSEGEPPLSSEFVWSHPSNPNPIVAGMPYLAGTNGSLESIHLILENLDQTVHCSWNRSTQASLGPIGIDCEDGTFLQGQLTKTGPYALPVRVQVQDWSLEARQRALHSTLYLTSANSVTAETDQQDLQLSAWKENESVQILVALVDQKSLENGMEVKTKLSKGNAQKFFKGKFSLQNVDARVLPAALKTGCQLQPKPEREPAKVSLHLSNTEFEQAGPMTLEIKITSASCQTILKKPLQDPLSERLKDQTITLGTYNIENFWDSVADNSVPYQDFSAESSNWYSDQIYKKKANTLLRAIVFAQSPDVLGIQELESAGNFGQSLNQIRIPLAKLGYGHSELGTQNPDFPVSVTQGILSRYPILEARSLRFDLYEEEEQRNLAQKPSSSARNPQIIKVHTGVAPIHIYNNHWKSLRGSKEFARQAHLKIARIIKSDIQNLEPDAYFAILGDFNSDHTYQYECQHEPCHVESGIRDVLLADQLSNLKSEGVYNPWFIYQNKFRCNYFYTSEPQCFDNVFMSPNLLKKGPLVLIEGGFTAYGTSGGIAEFELRGANGKAARWQRVYHNGSGDRYIEHLGIGYSDHFPVVAKLKVNGTKDFGQKVLKPESPIYHKESPESFRCGLKEYVSYSSVSRQGHPSSWNQKCVDLAKESGFRLIKEGILIFILVDGEKIVIAPAGNDSVAKSALQAQLESAAADNGRVMRIRGRLGWSYGFKTLFWFDRNDLEIQGGMKPCLQASDAVMDLGQLPARQQRWKNSLHKCIAFEMEVSVAPFNLQNSLSQVQAQLPGNLKVFLRGKLSQHFSVGGRYKVKGFGVLDYFRNKWQVNMQAFNTQTGDLTDLLQLN